MFTSLKKHGLSHTVHELKSQFTDSASKVSHQQSSKSKNMQPTSLVSKFQLKADDDTPKKWNVLQVLIQLLASKEQEACSINQHDFNPTKYLCLQESCKKKLGCSYCLLQNHKTHAKIETALCLKDLGELKQKVDLNKGKIKEELQKRKVQLRENIQYEISKIRQEFNCNLNYLNTKILDSIEKQFYQRQASIEKYLQKKEKIKQNEETLIQKRQKKNEFSFQDCQFTQILQAFNNRPSKDLFLSGHIQKTSSLGKTKMTRKEEFCIYDINKQDEDIILTKLTKLNLTEIQQYLRYERIIVQEFCQCLNIYSDYYNQMSASLSQFFANFKRGIPMFPSFHNMLKQPDILKHFSL